MAKIDNQELTLRCPNCNWECNYDDIYCSGCRTYINHVEMNPPNGSYLNIYEGVEELNFILKNDGVNDIHIDNVETKFNASNFRSVYLNRKAEKEFKAKFSSATFFQKEKFLIKNDKDLELGYTLELLNKPEIIKEIENITYFNGKYYIPSGTKQIVIKLRYSKGLDYVKNVKIDDSDIELEFEKNLKISDDLDYIIKASLLKGDFTRKFAINLETYSLGISNLEFETTIYQKTEIIREGIEDALKLKDALLVNTGKKNVSIIYEIKNSPIIIDQVVIQDSKFLSYSSYSDQNENKIKLNFEVDTSKVEFEGNSKTVTAKYTIKYRQKQTNIQDSYSDTLDLSFKQPEKLDNYLVIDFGTANTCLGYLKKNEYGSTETKLLEFYYYEDDDTSDKEDSVPSLLFVQDNKEGKYKSDKYTYTNLLKDINIFNTTVWGWKKFFGTEKNKLISDSKGYLKEYSIIDLTSIFLKRIIERFELVTGFKAEKFAFTFPAKYIEKKNDLIKAMKKLGYEESSIDLYLSEPNALAYYFVASGNYDFLHKENIELDKPVYFAIFDFGGGTTDITLAEVSKYIEETKYYDPDAKKEKTKKVKKINLEIIDSAAPDNFGGDYLDFELAKFIKNAIEDNKNIKIPFARDLEELTFSRDETLIRNTALLMHEARRIKVNYSEDIVDMVVTSLKSSDDQELNEISLKLEGVHDFLKNEIRKGMDYLQNIISIHNIESEYIFLCGNSSRLPIVKEIAQEKFPNCQIILPIDDLKNGVVKGALSYYSGGSDIGKFSINKTLHTSIGYNENNIFKLFQDEDDENIRTLRGLKLSKEPTYFDFPIRTYRNIDYEIIYSTEDPTILNRKITIINNNSVKVAGKIEIPLEIRNKEVYIRIYINENFPKIKYKIVCDNKLFREGDLILNI